MNRVIKGYKIFNEDWTRGNQNTGDNNVGTCNTGDFNFGYHNSGNYNTGKYNSGYCNSGNYNNGNYNTGDWNKGNYLRGVFNTSLEELTICMFNKPSNWTLRDWYHSEAYTIMGRCKTGVVLKTGGNPKEDILNGSFLRNLNEEDLKIWKESLTENEIKIIKSLPNYDDDIFYEIVGIRL